MCRLVLAFVLSLLVTVAAAQKPPPNKEPDFFRRPLVVMPKATDMCMSNDDRERIRAILFIAVDEALKDQVMHLFEVWMRDLKDQPDRAAQGARNAIDAYLHARETVVNWNPQPCNK
jgi:hypothetical protein